jgi:hypothetical protein
VGLVWPHHHKLAVVVVPRTIRTLDNVAGKEMLQQPARSSNQTPQWLVNLVHCKSRPPPLQAQIRLPQ